MREDILWELHGTLTIIFGNGKYRGSLRMSAEIEKLQDIINKSKNIVFFGGAGVSTESGIPDFRSQDGLYSENYGNVPPEEILSKDFFKKHPSVFYKFYREKILMQGSGLEIKPNKGHLKLAELEKAKKLKAIVTQNIDTLHQQAGSKEVYQIHGTIATNHCVKCGKEYSLEDVTKETFGEMICDCGFLIKPDVVLYDEPLPSDVWYKAVAAIKEADCLIVAGTSLSVYPAASLLNYFHGPSLVILNRTPTDSDSVADLIIREPIGEVLDQITV